MIKQGMGTDRQEVKETEREKNKGGDREEKRWKRQRRSEKRR